MCEARWGESDMESLEDVTTPPGKMSGRCCEGEAERGEEQLSASDVTEEERERDEAESRCLDCSSEEVSGLESATWAAEKLRSWDGTGTDVDTFRFAAEKGLLSVVDALLTGMIPAHSLVRRDILGNIQKIERSCRKAGVKTLEELVGTEIETQQRYSGSGREALLWLKRTIQFVLRAVQMFVDEVNSRKDDFHMADIVKKAYNSTLAPTHGIRAHAFRLFLNGVPSRGAFLGRLGKDPNQALLELEVWQQAFEPVAESVVDFVTENGLEHYNQLQRCRA
mmetsp:Transcript_11735/g.35755  ORF Transcript_11735/g.35755 Transcript_11735/m.35755 type:complete len:280 (+) Transcript_11735:3-842(+)